MTRAKATTVLKREASKAKEVLLQRALAAYEEALISNQIFSICEAARCFNVPRATLQARINGQKSILESNSDKSWLDDAKSQVIVNKLIHLAKQGFPEKKRPLLNRGNEVTQDKLGDPPSHGGG